MGIERFHARAASLASREPSELEYLISLKQLVPEVENRALFVLVNHRLSKSGCGPEMNMLYNRTNLNCIFLSATDEDFHAIRDELGLRIGYWGFIPNKVLGNAILIEKDGEELAILDSISPEDDLLIDWEAEIPIETNQALIKPAESDFSASLLKNKDGFYEHLLQRWQTLNSN
jgi:hypothetical protein